MFQCILCMKQFDDSLKSQEHIFPDSLGGTLTIWDMCSACNSHLGRFVDSPFLQFPPIATKRFLLKIPGKSGNIPNPLGDGVLGTDPTQKVQVRTADGKFTSLHLVPNFKRSTTPDGRNQVTIIVDKKDEDKLPEILEKIRARASTPGNEAKLVTESRFEGQIEQPNIHQTLTFHAFDWVRCLMKVAYELAYRKIGKQYLDDATASQMRMLLKLETIEESDLAPFQFQVSEVEKSTLFKNLNDPDSLYAVLFPVDKRLTCLVRVFDVIEALVVVSDDTRKFGVLTGDVLQIDIPNKKSKETDYYTYLTTIQPTPNGT